MMGCKKNLEKYTMKERQIIQNLLEIKLNFETIMEVLHECEIASSSIGPLNSVSRSIKSATLDSHLISHDEIELDA